MDINSAFPSKYLKADTDIPDGGDLKLTISGVEMATVGQGVDAEEKPVVFFDETTKGLVLNVTNKNTLVGLFGTDTDEWVGKRVALFATEVDFQGRQTLAIRIRMRAPKAKPVPVAAAAEDKDGEDIPF
jgi:hypothetical protein